MSDLVNLVLLFFTFSFLGWCVEVALKYRQYHRFINRGFLAGPWLPIYGSGATLITVGVGLLPRAEAAYQKAAWDQSASVRTSQLRKPWPPGIQ